ncbi:ABC transporter substrate-binding protein [Arthrobacter sp. StoSoilB5]|uniref:ABC transporter substrate-binding protein n=1 Tax=Arthrobacter sp. StoSoilB5 TaxID=2830992 RepID=UPI001CC6D69D|nr:ABC transporter substrate-binding protein [Arthrobacter sp. StoSoilB5]BCW44807.1 hypothetical protein StoSoilB5_19910 [Arthrobacter sp. StoSoilB5]
MAHYHRARRVATLLAVPILGSLALAGCSSNANPAGGGNEIAIAFGVTTGQTNPYQELAAEYQRQHPDVKLTLNAIPLDSYDQTIRTQLQSGNASDIIATTPGSGQASSVITLAKAGLLQPLDDSATKTIPKGNEELLQTDGKTYGQALGLTYIGTVVNESFIKETGISYPSDWNSLLEACSTAKSKGKSLFVIAGQLPPSTSSTAQIIAATRVYAKNPDWNKQRADKKVTFAGTQGWQDTLEAIVKMKDAGCFQDGAAGAGPESLTQNLGAKPWLAVTAPSSVTGELSGAAPDQSFSVSDFPPVSSGDKHFGYANANFSLSLTKSAPHTDAAKKFLNWAAEPEQTALFAKVQGTLPVGQTKEADLAGTPYANVSSQLAKGDYVAMPNSNWPNAAVTDALASGVQGLLTGQQTPDQVLRAMDSAWDKK